MSENGSFTAGYDPWRLDARIVIANNAILEVSMGRKYQSILETIGNTPVVRINRLAPQGVNLFVKIEAFNPLGSVKDRLAFGVIEAAEKSGELKPGQVAAHSKLGHSHDYVCLNFGSNFAASVSVRDLRRGVVSCGLQLSCISCFDLVA